MNITAPVLFAYMTAREFLASMIETARALALPVTSWRVGDPTLTAYTWLSEQLTTRDAAAAALGEAAWLSTAPPGYDTIVASEVYGIEREGATYAQPSVTVTNTGGGSYVIEPGMLRTKATSINKTYHSIGDSPVTLDPGGTATFLCEADEAGSASSVIANEIDAFVAPALLGLEIVSSTAAAARDEQSAAALRDACLDSLGALSPNGPDDAYEFVATRAELTGVDDIAFARANGDSTTGAVVTYVAGASGLVASASKTAALAAILKWATPKGHTPTVLDATPYPVAVTATAYGELPADFETRISSAIVAAISAMKISDGTLVIARSAFDAAAHAAVPALTRFVVTLPTTDALVPLGGKPYPSTITILQG